MSGPAARRKRKRRKGSINQKARRRGERSNVPFALWCKKSKESERKKGIKVLF